MKRKPCKCWFLWFIVAGSGSGGTTGGTNNPSLPGQVLPWKCWRGASARYHTASLFPTGKYRKVTAATWYKPLLTVKAWRPYEEALCTFGTGTLSSFSAIFFSYNCHRHTGKPDIQHESQKQLWITAWLVGRHLSVLHLSTLRGCWLWFFKRKHS